MGMSLVKYLNNVFIREFGVHHQAFSKPRILLLETQPAVGSSGIN